MPTQENRTAPVGISSSIAMFLLLTSVCCMLSLWSTGQQEPIQPEHHNSSSDWQVDGAALQSGGRTARKARLPSYVPNIAMLCVMSIGIAAMIAFKIKQEDLTTEGHECQLTNRHIMHSKYALWSITAFFVGGSILDLNYLLVEITCVRSWVRCDRNELEVFWINLVEVMFHIGSIIFASCETIVCWTIKFRNFKPSQWVWHALAFVQAANIAQWFDSLLKESYHRIYENSESFDSYFSFCSHNSSHSDHAWCSESSIAALWFVWSSPFLFPITIEFALLVSETLLDRVIGGGIHTVNEVEDDRNHDEIEPGRPVNGEIIEVADERMPLLQPAREIGRENGPLHQQSVNSSCRSKIFILVSLIINIVYLVLTILVFIGYKTIHTIETQTQLQAYDNAFTVYSVLYDLFSIACCAVGIASCRKFRRPHSHTSFLEYLLLFATAGVLLQSIKRIVAFSLNSANSDWIAAYYMVEILDMVQSLVQIVFYYYAKDVKLQLANEGRHGDSRCAVVVFKTILTVTSLCNFVTWISDSFLLPEMSASITPSNYFIEQWAVFDNAVTPITIFFRFNSALLFWCIGTDVLRPGELHRE